MSKLDTVRAMIEKAGREDTPIEEARATALQAARMIVKHGFVITDSGITESPETDRYDDFYVPNFDDDDAVELTPFTLDVAKHNMQCVECKKEIRKGVPYARESQSKHPAVTHWDQCREYFTRKG